MMKMLLIVLFASLSSSPAFAGDSLPDCGNEHKFDYHFLEALRLKEKGDHTGAHDALQQALNIDSTSSAALFELSRYYLFLKNDVLALDALQKAVHYNPEHFEYKIALAGLCREMRKYPESIAIYEELAGKYPAKPEIHFYLSDLYLRMRQIDKSISALDALENNTGINEAVSMQKYHLYNHIGKSDDAVREVEKLREKFPLEVKYPIIMGDFYLEKEDTVRALICYNQAYRLDPDNPYYFLSMSRYYEYRGDEEAAIREIDRALRNPSLDVETKLEILGKYIRNLPRTQKDRENANALLETLLEQHSREKELNMIYGEFLLLQNKTEEARFQFRIVTEADPENKNAWRQLLTIALNQDRMDEAIAICDNALTLFPEAPEFYFYKGNACYRKKEYKTALEIFKTGLEVIPKDNHFLLSGFYGQIGDLYYHLNEKEKAYQAYDSALEYDDSNLLILNNYAHFLSLDKKDLDKAERMSAKCVRQQPNNAIYTDTYAWIFFQKGNYSLARFYIENALSKNSENSPDIVEHYGDILFRMGNVDKALQEWEKALNLKEADGSDTELLKRKINNKTYYEAEN